MLFFFFLQCKSWSGCWELFLCRVGVKAHGSVMTPKYFICPSTACMPAGNSQRQVSLHPRARTIHRYPVRERRPPTARSLIDSPVWNYPPASINAGHWDSEHLKGQRSGPGYSVPWETHDGYQDIYPQMLRGQRLRCVSTHAVLKHWSDSICTC